MSNSIRWELVPDEFVIFDLETTGLDSEKHNILEIAAVRFTKEQYLDNGQIDTFQTFIKQTQPIPKKIIEITSITDEMVSDGETLHEALPNFFDFAGSRKLIAYNAPFDTKFIRQAAKIIDFSLPRPFSVDCALELARERLIHMPNYKLGTVAQAFQIDTSGAHRALQDCVMTLHVYVNLTQIETRQTPKNKTANVRLGRENPDYIPASSKSSIKTGRLLGSLTGSLIRILKGK